MHTIETPRFTSASKGRPAVGHVDQSGDRPTNGNPPTTAVARRFSSGWQPQSDSQEAVLMSSVFEVLYEGTRGPGKTETILMDFVQDVGQGYGAAWRGILFRRTYKELQDVIAKSCRLFPRACPGGKYNSTDHSWKWPTGEQLLLRYFATPQDYWNYHGHEYPWIGWEELTTWPTPECYVSMLSCCRSSGPAQMPRKYRATTNPYGCGHNWVKARFRLPVAPGRLSGPVIRDSRDRAGNLEPERIAIHGSLSENKVLLGADPQYINRIRASASSDSQLRAWLQGSWDIVAGGMLDDLWDPALHVVPAFQIPYSWRMDRSFDWGSSHPFAVCWWAESDGSPIEFSPTRSMHTVRGDLFLVAEWYGCREGRPNEGLRLTAAEIADGIREREQQLFAAHTVLPGPADSGIFDQDHGVSIAREMRDRGIRWQVALKGPGSRRQGWARIRGLLKSARPPLTSRAGTRERLPRELPGLFICENCEHWLRTVPVLPRCDRDPDDVDTQAEDHLGDATRYRVYQARRALKTLPLLGR